MDKQPTVVAPAQTGVPVVYGKERSGRCRQCNVRYLWDRKLGQLKDMRCPFCDKRLYLTNYLWKGTTLRILEKPL